MIVRGTVDDVAANAAGQLSAAQRDLLQRLRLFRLNSLPNLILGAALLALGVLRGDWLGWVCVALGVFVLLSAWQRQRQRQALAVGRVAAVEGVLERVRSTPLAAFEAELRLNNASYVLAAGLGAEPLQAQARYRLYVLEGASRMGLVVAMEAL